MTTGVSEFYHWMVCRINGSDGKDIGQTQLAQPPQTTGALMNAGWWFQKISLIGPGSLWN